MAKLTKKKRFCVGIIGASGFTGYELIKILEKHPSVELKIANSSTYAQMHVKSVYPAYKGNVHFTNFSIDAINAMGLDVVFLAVPHGVAPSLVSQLKAKVVDLSPEYRFHDKSLFEKAYGTKMDSSRKSIYGLPEVCKEQIKKSKLIGNPGCYATGMILSSLPIQKKASYIIFDCKSGWSGAGKESVFAKDKNLLTDNLIAYKLTKHRHKYEVMQFITTPLSFTPHVFDTYQGMMITSHFLLKGKGDPKSITELYRNFYKGCPFVEVVSETPQIRDVQGTNKIMIGGFEIDENNQLVVVAVLDNLIKGASGQAVQNMNIMLGLKETEGLQ
ncbi:MAG TPA: N-acetyl-gamma-glutamyl-phosphate reductase [Candidatus Nanoarchaeia archaeon]|nr:N-acetyl-gamma-glutamyl-phosphate reductase [Candidatus Nanoarchaeia archaeon]